MRRAHRLKYCEEICFIDSTGSCDQGNSSVTFLFTSSKVGALPLACVVHTSQTEDEYTEIFRLILSTLGKEAFFGKGFPRVIVTDDSSAERNALRTVFPKATLFLCIFHFCQSIWRWLWNSDQNIHKEHRPLLMQLVRSILFAKTTDECVEYYDILKNDITANKYKNFLKYMDDYWIRNKEWCLCFRKEYFTRGNNTNNYAESSIRIFKDIILQRCRVYNAMALVKFVTEVLEEYHKKRLLKFANSRVSKPYISYFNFIKKSKNLIVTEITKHTFHVSSSQDSKLLYTVNITTETCDCFEGFSGKFCKHIFAIHLKTNMQFLYLPSLSANDRIDLARLALGDKVPVDFFLGMDEKNYANQDIPELSAFATSTGAGNDEISHLHGEPQVINEADFQQEYTKFKENIDKVVRLTETCHSDQMLMLMKRFNKNLEQINTETQLKCFFANTTAKLRTKNTKYLGVQPTALSRRKNGSRGSKRKQAGRPAKKQKKKRCLSQAISKNTPNAKGH